MGDHIGEMKQKSKRKNKKIKKINANDIDDLQRFVCFTFLPLLNDGEGGRTISQLTNNGMEEKSCIKTHFCVICGGFRVLIEIEIERLPVCVSFSS